MSSTIAPLIYRKVVENWSYRDICNLDQIDESNTEDNSSVGGILEQAKDRSSICDNDDDDDGDDDDGDDEHSLASLTH